MARRAPGSRARHSLRDGPAVPVAALPAAARKRSSPYGLAAMAGRGGSPGVRSSMRWDGSVGRLTVWCRLVSTTRPPHRRTATALHGPRVLAYGRSLPSRPQLGISLRFGPPLSDELPDVVADLLAGPLVVVITAVAFEGFERNSMAFVSGTGNQTMTRKIRLHIGGYGPRRAVLKRWSMHVARLVKGAEPPGGLPTRTSAG